MPSIEANGISVNYALSGPEQSSSLVVLINGLADDLSTWDAQVPSLVEAGYRVLRYDNRGIGASSAPEGPYTAALMAEDLHALLLALFPAAQDGAKKLRFHLLGVSMGGMIAQAYALAHPNGSDKRMEMLSLSLCCTYAEPSTFCERMFNLWADMARSMGVPTVMRDVTLWAFTVPFFRKREDELREVEKAMEGLEMGLDAYLSQLNVIQKFDTTGPLDGLKAQGKVLGGFSDPRSVLVLAGKTDILIPVALSRELAERIEGSQFLTVKGGHACLWEFPEDFNRTVIAFFDVFKANT